MKSRTTRAFRKLLASLPVEARDQARNSYSLFAENVRHPSLHYKQVHTTEPIFSVRVGRSYRAVGLVQEADLIVWFWIGPHDQYERLLASL